MGVKGKHFKQEQDIKESAEALYTHQVREARALSFIKWAAMFFLIVDHASLALFDNIEIGRILGRIAFPLFAYMIAVGAQYSSNPRKYLVRLVIFACISEIPFDLLVSNVPFDFRYANVLFTFSIALGSLLIIKRLGSSVFVWIGVSCTAFALAELMAVDYGGIGVLGVLVYYVGMYGCSGEKLRPRLGQILGLGTIALGWPLYQSIFFYLTHGHMVFIGTLEVFALLAAIFLLFSKAGPAYFPPQSKRRAKLWYLVYPGHIIVVCCLVYVLGIYELPQAYLSLPKWVIWW